MSDSFDAWISRRRGGFLIPCGIAAVVVAALALRVQPMIQPHPSYLMLGDHHKYAYMAENGPLSFHVAPFCWRPGLPAVVRALPFDTQTGFGFLTILILWANGVVVYYLTRATGRGAAVSLFAMLTFLATGWATKYPLFNFWLPDPAALLLVTLIVLCAYTDRLFAGALLLAVGVLLKESVLFAGPLLLTVPCLGPSRRRQLLKGAAAVAPAAALLLAMRFAVPARNNDPAYMMGLPQHLTEVDEGRTSYDYVEQLQRVSGNRWRDLNCRTLESVHSYTVGSFGVLPLCLALAAPRRNARLLWRASPFLLLVYMQLLVATDTQRLLVLAMPIVVLMAVNGLEALVRGWRLSVVGTLAFPATIIAMNLWRSVRMAGPSIAEGETLAGLFLVLWLMTVWRRKVSREAQQKT